MLQQPQFRNLPLPSVKPDPESAGLLDASQMQIYDRIIMAAMKDEDSNLATSLRELAAVPIEERYISSVIAALGYSFGDFDSACIKLDLETLPESEWERMPQLLDGRTIKFFILLRTAFREEQIEEIVTEAMRHARIASHLRAA